MEPILSKPGRASKKYSFWVERVDKSVDGSMDKISGKLKGGPETLIITLNLLFFENALEYGT